MTNARVVCAFREFSLEVSGHVGMLESLAAELEGVGAESENHDLHGLLVSLRDGAEKLLRTQAAAREALNQAEAAVTKNYSEAVTAFCAAPVFIQ